MKTSKRKFSMRVGNELIIDMEIGDMNRSLFIKICKEAEKILFD